MLFFSPGNMVDKLVDQSQVAVLEQGVDAGIGANFPFITARVDIVGFYVEVISDVFTAVSLLLLDCLAVVTEFVDIWIQYHLQT